MNIIVLIAFFMIQCFCIESAFSETHAKDHSSQSVTRPVAAHSANTDVSQLIGVPLERSVKVSLIQIKDLISKYKKKEISFPSTKINAAMRILRGYKEQIFCQWDPDKKQPLNTFIGFAESLLGQEALKKVADHSSHKTDIQRSFQKGIDTPDKSELLDLVYFHPYSEFAQEALFRLMSWALDHGNYPEAKFYIKLIHNRFPEKKAILSPQLEVKELYITLAMGESLDKNKHIKTSLETYLATNPKKGIFIHPDRLFSYGQVVKSVKEMTQDIKQESVKEMTQDIKQEKAPSSYAKDLLAQLEQDLYLNPPSQKTIQAFKILRLLPSHFSEEFDKNLCDIATVINRNDQLQVMIGAQDFEKLEDYLSLVAKKLGKEKTLSFVKQALDDKASDVRTAAANALPNLAQHIGKEKTLSFVKQAIEDKDLRVRSAAAKTLPDLAQHIGKEKTLSFVKQALEDKKWYVRSAAVKTLPDLAQHISAETTLSLVKQALEDKDSYVRKAATYALKIIESK